MEWGILGVTACVGVGRVDQGGVLEAPQGHREVRQGAAGVSQLCIGNAASVGLHWQYMLDRITGWRYIPV